VSAAYRLEVDAEVVKIRDVVIIQVAERCVDKLDAGHSVLSLGLLGIHFRLAQVVLNAVDGVQRVRYITKAE
jgi:hypothetical protein